MRYCTRAVRTLHRLSLGAAIFAAGCAYVDDALAQNEPRESQEGTRLTLSDAVRLAKERAPSVHLALARVTSAEAIVDRSGASLLPTVSVSGSGNALIRDGQVYASGIVASTRNESYLAAQSSLQVRWPIYDFGQTSSAIASAKAGVISAHQSAEAVQQDAMAEAAIVFFSLLADSEFVRAGEEIRTQRENVLAITHRQVESGYRMPLDEIRAQVALEEARLNLSLAEATRDSHSVSLSNALLLDPGAELRLIAPGPLAVDETKVGNVAAAIEARRDVAAARSRVDQTERGLEAARRARLPILAAQAAGTVVYIHDRASSPGQALAITDGFTKLATGGITLSVPIFDPFTAANIKIAEGATREAQAYLDQVKLTARSQTSQALTQLRRARVLLEQSQRLAAEAKINLEQVQERYASGIDNPLSLADAERQDALGRVAVIRARLAVNVAEVRLLASLSRMDELLANR